MAEVPESAAFAAGSEQGFIMVRSSILDDLRGSLPLFAHEAAHGWWGNLVRSEGPGAQMLSEALAQYGAVLSIEALEGEGAARDSSLLAPRLQPPAVRARLLPHRREGGDAALATLADAPTHHNLSDSKGMWFYHMLRGRLGVAAFFEVLRATPRRFLDLADERARHPRRVPGRAARPTAGSAGFLDQVGRSCTGSPCSMSNGGRCGGRLCRGTTSLREPRSLHLRAAALGQPTRSTSRCW